MHMVRGVADAPHNHAEGTKAHWTPELVVDVWDRTLLVRMYDDLVAKVQAMNLVEVLEDGGDRVNAAYASVVAVIDDDGGDHLVEYGLEEDDSACDAGYPHAETTHGAVGAIPHHEAEVHDSDPQDGFYCIRYDLDDHCMAMVEDDCTESDGTNTT